MDVYLRIIGALVALVAVLLLAWLLLRWMNRRVPGMAGNAKMIKVLDRVNVGKGGIMMLVRVQDKVILMVVNDHVAEKLLEFDDPDGTFDPKTGDTPSFSNALKDAAKRFGGKDKGDML